MSTESKIRNLVVVLGDQLSLELQPFDEFNRDRDAIWMVEAHNEATHVWSHKQRLILFLTAMRHFKEFVEEKGIRIFYTAFTEPESGSIGGELRKFLSNNSVQSVVFSKPGEFRVEQELTHACEMAGVPHCVEEDASFFCSEERFSQWANGRKQLRMEYFYREMRKENNVLMDEASPVGGEWNYDSSNRSPFGKSGPVDLPSPLRFDPDEITKEVIEVVETHYQDHPGDLESFHWPVTASQAKEALENFIANGLPGFGRYQDAMWEGEPFLHHSLLAAAMNLKLLLPREVVEAVERSYREDRVSIESAEGFIRQVLGWREYVRGVYWRHMPSYVERNFLDAHEPLPDFYWTGDTSMNCMRQCVSQTLEFGYAHHIQRLMVTGLFGLLWGVDPKKMHEWYLAVYVDAVEWVELPNTMGMSQYADGGIMASKPYVATGQYINRMSNYCKGCRYDPTAKEGEHACPFTVLYWNFLFKHEHTLKSNPRMGLQLRNAQRFDSGQREEIQTRSNEIRARLLAESKRN